jgi:hypothetical protein
MHTASGIEVKVNYERSWHKTFLRACRILRARLYAREKGLRKLEQAGDIPLAVSEIRLGEYAVEWWIEGNRCLLTTSGDEECTTRDLDQNTP